MNKISYRRDVFLLVTCFVVSRWLVNKSGVTFGYDALFDYWQYLDVKSLQQNLFNSLWYQHGQPPVFNFLLGLVLKLSGDQAPVVFQGILMLVSFLNGWLLLKIIRSQLPESNAPVVLSLLYVLSPATILIENELFYTSFVSFFLLLAYYAVARYKAHQSWLGAMVIFSALTLLCLTRSTYHLSWLAIVSGLLLYYARNKAVFNKLLTGSVLSLLLVGGWYLKNVIVFGNFSASSWLGMNLARIVFHDVEVKDSSSISSVHPFYPVASYKKFISTKYKRFAGLNDRVLLSETKNGSYVNLNHTAYLEVSAKYMDASLQYMRGHPATYLKHVVTSMLIFFTPASSYYKLENNSNRISYYDTFFGANLSHLVKEKVQKKKLLALAAVPVMIIYAGIFGMFIRDAWKKKRLSPENAFALITMLFSFTVSTLLEYGENMRYRFEIQPLFLILVAHAVLIYRSGRVSKRAG